MRKKQKVLILEGPPACGKTTWAHKWVAESPQTRVNVNRDDFRAMLGEYNKNNEAVVKSLRNAAIISALEKGLDVVVSDTNIHKAGEREIKTLLAGFFENPVNASKFDVEIEIKTFDTPLKECIVRDRIREAKGGHSVGEKVIRRMFKEYFQKALHSVEPYPVDKNLPWAVWLDVDGTIAHMVDRKPYEWSRVGEDIVDIPVLSIVNAMKQFGDLIVVVSGRDGQCESETRQWFKDNNIPIDYLFMRQAGDSRKDSIVKKEIFEKHISGNFNIRFCLDDRDQVVEMLRNEIGLKVLQVDYGDF